MVALVVIGTYMELHVCVFMYTHIVEFMVLILYYALHCTILPLQLPANLYFI